MIMLNATRQLSRSGEFSITAQRLPVLGLGIVHNNASRSVLGKVRNIRRRSSPLDGSENLGFGGARRPVERSGGCAGHEIRIVASNGDNHLVVGLKLQCCSDARREVGDPASERVRSPIDGASFLDPSSPDTLEDSDRVPEKRPARDVVVPAACKVKFVGIKSAPET
jgi:hypothetical protein